MGEASQVRVTAAAYDGVDTTALARRWSVPLVSAYEQVGSTMDVAHDAAGGGAADGTVVVADGQSAGRGRHRREWASPHGAGIWLTLIARPDDGTALGVLSLRVGLRSAAVLESFAAGPVGLKWPNDLYVGGRKLGGILTEIRWHDQRPLWVAIGVGINIRPPAGMPAAGLVALTSRLSVLDSLVPALRRAAASRGPLTSAELAEYGARDIARGQRCRSPVAGRVSGISASGELLVVGDGEVEARPYRAGSLVLLTDEGAAAEPSEGRGVEPVTYVAGGRLGS